MTANVKFFLISLLLISALANPVLAQTVKCSECGMTCDIAAKFTARIVLGDQTLYFCDIGDLFSFITRKKPNATRMEVKDYLTGDWMDAHKAYYVHAEKKFKTPMGWGIAAFLDKDKASGYGTAMDFDGTASALK